MEVRHRTSEQPTELLYDDKILGYADLQKGQYVMRTQTPTATALTMKSPTSIETWHARMGHLGYQNLLRLNQQAKDVDIKESPPKDICGDCMKDRQQRHPSRTPMIRTTQALHRVHSDLMGPLPTTQRGDRYLMMLKDDYSGAQWVYPLRTKSQAFSTFKEFKAMLENQTKEKLKFLRSDGGGEYASSEFQTSEGKWDQAGAYRPP